MFVLLFGSPSPNLTIQPWLLSNLICGWIWKYWIRVKEALQNQIKTSKNKEPWQGAITLLTKTTCVFCHQLIP